jgi:hypothetical protein
MPTKEDLKREVDRLPQSLVEEVYVLLKRVIEQRKASIEKNNWNEWRHSLDNFTPDFMDYQQQPASQIPESLDS